ncbi:purple acid phosphatase family protein [Fibrella aquatilis]|uniref:Metallophosphoesterase family protein n=1 Tax=Fibrella aquatilis TaxID=2817059 RepID=A0A939G5A5_9BACT|nr:metallophosphoesterase family protein [Fibrella aquatilis]MBO0932389.1 metallophosphoesterase family protein [Fibrella aquatilis]
MKLFLPFLFCITLSQLAHSQDRQPSGVFIAQPYLQIGRTPSPQTMQVLWHAPDSTANWQVEYQRQLGGDWTKAEVPTVVQVAVAGTAPHRVYNASLTGLMPGGKFTYRVLKDGNVVFISEGQAIKSATQPYRFVAFADIGAETPNQKKLAGRAFQAKPDFVVVPGDIVYERGLISEYRAKFWPIYNANKLDTAGAPLLRSVPMITAPGNHDTDTRDLDKYPNALSYFYYWHQPLNGPASTEGGPLMPTLTASADNRKAFEAAAGAAYARNMANYSFDYGNAHWTVIDSNPYVDYTDKAFQDWVAADLAKAKDATWRFVMFHHPGFNSAREHYEQQHTRLMAPVFEAGKVDVVFNGHVHNYQRSYPLTFVPDRKGVLLVASMGAKTARGRVVNGRWTLDKAFDGKRKTKPNGIIYVVTGAGGQTLYNPEQNNDPDSWQKFTQKFFSNVHSLTIADVTGKTLFIRQIDANGKELDSFKVTK